MNLTKVCLKILLGIPVVLLAFMGVLAFLYIFVCGYFRGPVVVQSCASPDGKHVAYVQDFPSFDPPNQRAFVERSDKSRVMYITAFAEDVDFIKQIVWSPDSLIVVFQSKDYLTITRVTDWLTIRISLTCEWKMVQVRDRMINTWGGPNREVDTIKFPRPMVMAYHIIGEKLFHEVDLNALIQNETTAQPPALLDDSRK